MSAGGLDEALVFEIVSVSPSPPAVLARRVAAVLDAAGDLRPDRGGRSARTRQLGAGGMGGLVEELGAQDDLWLVFERREVGLWGDVRLYADTRLATAPQIHAVTFRLPLDRVLDQPALLERALGLLAEVFTAVGGFFGMADTAAMLRRRMDLRTAATERGAMWVPRWDDPTFVIWDRWVEDVWWVNLYGPAYVERWGRAVFDRMGVATRDLAGGGVLVRSAEEPPDPFGSATLSGFPHKQASYAVLGAGTFVHESLEVPERGVLVPTLHEHAEAVRPT